jgi:DNA repair exonuclease SbcCD ATPase subunit
MNKLQEIKRLLEDQQVPKKDIKWLISQIDGLGEGMQVLLKQYQESVSEVERLQAENEKKTDRIQEDFLTLEGKESKMIGLEQKVERLEKALKEIAEFPEKAIDYKKAYFTLLNKAEKALETEGKE